jgi:hypothetical protein
MNQKELLMPPKDKREIGRCKACKHWLEPKPYQEIFELIHCKKSVLTPVNGNWGCWEWKEGKA